jgi:hypothetical protein
MVSAYYMFYGRRPHPTHLYIRFPVKKQAKRHCGGYIVDELVLKKGAMDSMSYPPVEMETDRMNAVLLFNAKPIINMWQMDGETEMTVWYTEYVKYFMFRRTVPAEQLDI